MRKGMEIDSGQNIRIAPAPPRPFDRPADKNYIFRLPTVLMDRWSLTIFFLRSQSIDLAEREVIIDDWLFGLSLTSL